MLRSFEQICEGADRIANSSLDEIMVTVGMILCIVSISAAYLTYTKKDIH